jgi:hypothetical protein
MHDFNRECMDCREVFDPTMDNGDAEFDPTDNNGDIEDRYLALDDGDLDGDEQWLPDDPEYHATFDLDNRDDMYEDTMSDIWADADTLASVGQGMDEDYGYYDGDDY